MKGFLQRSKMKKSIQKFIGGLRWGNLSWRDKPDWYDFNNATIPFASLEITDDTCILTRSFFGFVMDKYILSFSDIEYVSVRRVLFSKGILFVHKNKKLPKHLCFWTFAPRKVCDALIAKGIIEKSATEI